MLNIDYLMYQSMDEHDVNYHEVATWQRLWNELTPKERKQDLDRIGYMNVDMVYICDTMLYMNDHLDEINSHLEPADQNKPTSIYTFKEFLHYLNR